MYKALFRDLVRMILNCIPYSSCGGGGGGWERNGAMILGAGALGKCACDYHLPVCVHPQWFCTINMGDMGTDLGNKGAWDSYDVIDT